MRDWLRLATKRSVVRRGLGYSVVVGTVLMVINQGDVVLSGELTRTHFVKIGLTYLVPFAVSTLSSVGAMRNAVRI
ncbi:hypothetical protein Pla52o_27600 [Novipirellula galeiformis]|uniref:Phosphoenolpyruvate protein kinase n=1 Tax=Novipirellula galeiformis TaxID=2528004 RepID=A0A5C6CIA4_9BACT|nr:nitrate/nitrite transporter NrtS [Novipirellula galeiformis]TWU23224.1 hypothetical protein Pla52o_27600 [Novipirellula galeiformis]